MKKNALLISNLVKHHELTHLIRIMRTTVFLIFVVVFQMIATEAGAQKTKINISKNELSLRELISEIEKQTDYLFVYKDSEINVSERVKVDARNKPVADVLKQVFANGPVTYEYANNYISLRIMSEKEQLAVSQQQKKQVSGTVVDEHGEPIIGANVVEKGTTNGIITDIDGKFALSVAESAVLQVSYIGYIPQEISVRNQRTFTFTLSEDFQLLDEVVVVGYGTVRRKNFTGSVSTVNVANSPIALSSRTNVMDMLRGTVTGTNISRETNAGSAPSIEIHGQKSIKSDNSNPLIVMDGMIYMGGWRDIDPSTVESLSVLKDATSLAAYGSQAANGVIMITTKKGTLGKPVINFDASLATSSKTMMPELLSPEDFVSKTNYAKGVTDGNPQSWMKPSSYENYLAGKTTDWLDYATQTGLTQNYSVSVSGATEKLNYFLSLSHTDQKGILIGDEYSREAVLIRLQNDITDWLQIGAQANYTYNNYDGIASTLRPFLNPYGQATRPNGELEKYVVEDGAMNINPLWDTYKAGNRDDYERYSTTLLKGHLLLKAPWIKGLSYRLNLSYSEEKYIHDEFMHEGHYVAEGIYTNDDRYAPETIAGYLSSANGKNQRRLNNYYVIDNILNYNGQFGNHFVDLTAVYTRDRFSSDGRTLNGNNFASIGNTLLGYNGLAFAGTQTVGIAKTKKTNIGYLGRINYNYNDTYHLSVSVRRDGSSVFGVDKKWGVFPAVGAAWTVSREKFLEDIDLINFLKVKASWGKNGNQSLDPYGTLSTIKLGQTGNHPYVFGNTNHPSWSQYVDAIGNPELGWETTTAINAGFEVGLLGDRIRFELDMYKSQTTDQIFERMIPVMSNGFNRTKATMGQIDNKGVEFTINTVNVRNKDFMWSSMLNFYLNRNKLVELYGDGKDDISSRMFLGKSLGAIYDYKVIGIVQEEDTEYMKANNTSPGYPKYANIDGSEDGKITIDDRTILGYDKENFRMNMSHTFVYKDWELYALFTGVFSGGDYGVIGNPEAYITQPDAFMNVNHIWWTPENRSNKYPTPIFGGGNYTPVMSYGFVRLQDLNLSYTFRQAKLKDIGIKNLRVYASAKNLFTITNWVGGDPEIKQKFGGWSTMDSYPLQRTFSLGINLSF